MIAGVAVTEQRKPGGLTSSILSGSTLAFPLASTIWALGAAHDSPDPSSW